MLFLISLSWTVKCLLFSLFSVTSSGLRSAEDYNTVRNTLTPHTSLIPLIRRVSVYYFNPDCLSLYNPTSLSDSALLVTVLFDHLMLTVALIPLILVINLLHLLLSYFSYSWRQLLEFSTSSRVQGPTVRGTPSEACPLKTSGERKSYQIGCQIGCQITFILFWM